MLNLKQNKWTKGTIFSRGIGMGHRVQEIVENFLLESRRKYVFNVITYPHLKFRRKFNCIFSLQRNKTFLTDNLSLINSKINYRSRWNENATDCTPWNDFNFPMIIVCHYFAKYLPEFSRDRKLITFSLSYS